MMMVVMMMVMVVVVIVIVIVIMLVVMQTVASYTERAGSLTSKVGPFNVFIYFYECYSSKLDRTNLVSMLRCF